MTTPVFIMVKSMKVEMVWWYDACCDSGWESVRDVTHHKQLTLSVGFVIKESKQALVIANTFDPETDTCNGRMTIPIGMIKKRRVMWQDPKSKKKIASVLK